MRMSFREFQQEYIKEGLVKKGFALQQAASHKASSSQLKTLVSKINQNVQKGKQENDLESKIVLTLENQELIAEAFQVASSQSGNLMKTIVANTFLQESISKEIKKYFSKRR